MTTPTTIFRCLPAFAAVLLGCPNLTAWATSLPPAPPQTPSAAQRQTRPKTRVVIQIQPSSQTQVGVQTQPGTPVFSLGTISVAPSPQTFRNPASTSSKPGASQPRRPARRSRRIAPPAPLRIYSRA